MRKELYLPQEPDTPASAYAFSLMRKIQDNEISTKDDFAIFHQNFVTTLPKEKILGLEEVYKILNIQEIHLLLAQKLAVKGYAHYQTRISIVEKAQALVKEFFDES